MQGALELLAGLEFAEPQEYPRDLARLRQYPMTAFWVHSTL